MVNPVGPPELSARLYISDLGLGSFQHLVGELLGVKLGPFGSISVQGFGVDAGQNENYDRRCPERSPSPDHPDWLFYRWTIWIEAEAPEATREGFVEFVGRLAAGLTDHGASVVVAAEYEDAIDAVAARYCAAQIPRP